MADGGGAYIIDDKGERVLVERTAERSEQTSNSIENPPAAVYTKPSKKKKSTEDLDAHS